MLQNEVVSDKKLDIIKECFGIIKTIDSRRRVNRDFDRQMDYLMQLSITEPELAYRQMEKLSAAQPITDYSDVLGKLCGLIGPMTEVIVASEPND